MEKQEKKKVLLIEPNYNNKFPPVALMKLATYYRNLGNWEVVFFKGDLKSFVIERITDKLIKQLNAVETGNIDWFYHRELLFNYLKTRKSVYLDSLPINESEASYFIETAIQESKDYFWKGKWETEPEWDRIGITTLFTFYWDITIETINFAKKMVKDTKDLMIGGVLASIQPDEIQAATGIRPHVGLLNHPGDLDEGDTQIIDELELDYSILDEIDYEYPMTNAYYRYTTRGCIRKCPFCAVTTLEPVFCSYIPLKTRLERVARLYGEQKDLLLMDNNILASKDFEKIINEIKECGFERGATFKKQNLLTTSIRNLKDGLNDRAYIKKSWKLMYEFYKNLTDKEESFRIFCILEKYFLISPMILKKENVLAAYEEIKESYNSHFKPGNGSRRYVDFNQGVDARLFTPEKAKLLSSIAIHPLRIAFDDLKTKDSYEKAIRMSVEAGITDFSNYLLYNFNDHPDDLYRRLKINVQLCDELGVSIYSFPMKYHPIKKTEDMDQDYSHNRDYIGKHWNRKYIRAIQSILNSTKGKIGRGRSYFNKAFGNSLTEFHKLLDMPETMIIYRLFFDWLGQEEGHYAAKQILGSDCICNWSTSSWWEAYKKCKDSLSLQDWKKVLGYIHKNKFSEEYPIKNEKAEKLLDFYTKNKKNMVETDSDFLKLKKAYDENPIIKNRMHGHKNLIAEEAFD